MTHLGFKKEVISRFHMWNFESDKPFSRKVHFLAPLEQPKFPGISIVMNYASSSNI